MVGSVAVPNMPYLFVGRTGYYCDDEGRTSAASSPLLPLQVRGRFYRPDWGRWVNQDPLRFDAAWRNATLANGVLPGMENWYLYVLNNPINATDPSGLLLNIGSYGNYCGPGGGGKPVDALDRACQSHDNCYSKCGGPGGVWGVVCPSRCRRNCDAALCSDAWNANCGSNPYCLTYRRGVLSVFCLKGTNPI